VRRAFLCGVDEYSGNDYEHRKEWVRRRLQQLAQAFAVEVLAYAVLSNHAHEVLRNRPDIAAEWTADEVARRWLSIFPTRTMKDVATEEAMARAVELITRRPKRVATLRRRLSDLSWFMRARNEFIARQSNLEDGCTGRFWEGRFFSQRLLDEASILACMCYVDLNPVRAKIAESLEDPAFTSAYDRIVARQAQERLSILITQARIDAEDPSQSGCTQNPRIPTPPAFPDRNDQLVGRMDQELRDLAVNSLRAHWLIDLNGPESPFSWIKEREYLLVLDETGRILRSDKGGVISPTIRPILESLGIDAGHWVDSVRRYRRLFRRVAGRSDRMRELARQVGQHWFKGCVSGQSLYLAS